MISLYIDTNVILDVLQDRKPFSDYAIQIIDSAIKGKINLYTSAISINNTYYILRKNDKHRNIIKQLRMISSIIEIIELDNGILQSAMNSDFSDLEDAIQYYSAVKIPSLKAIVTRDVNGFKKGKLTVLAPAEAVKLFN